MNLLPLISVPIIATVVYWTIEVIKYATGQSKKLKRFIPLIAAGLGILIGIVCFLGVPAIIPTDNIFVAIILGASSGLSAVGINQTFKQLGKSEEDGK